MPPFGSMNSLPLHMGYGGMGSVVGVPPFGVGILDTYPAAFAVSLRKLRADATLCARIRNSSNVELDIGFAYNEVLGGYWIDRGAVEDHCGAGMGYVTRWYVQTAGGGYITQANAARQPYIYSTGVGMITASHAGASRFAMYYGLDVQMEMSAYVGLVNAAPMMHAFCITRLAAVNDAGQFLSFDGSVNSKWRFAASTVTNQRQSVVGQATGSGTNQVSSKAATYTYSGAQWQTTHLYSPTLNSRYIRLNGNRLGDQVSSTASGTTYASTNATQARIGQSDVFSNAWQGYVNEIILYNNYTGYNNLVAIENDQITAWAT